MGGAVKGEEDERREGKGVGLYEEGKKWGNANGNRKGKPKPKPKRTLVARHLRADQVADLAARREVRYVEVRGDARGEEAARGDG